MQRMRFLGVAGLALTIAACSAVNYSADYDRQAVFASYGTYDWLLPSQIEQEALERINPFLERRLRRAVASELADRGFVRSATGDPDIWVSVYPVVPGRSAGPTDGGHPRGAYRGSRTRVSLGFALGFGYPYQFGGYGYPWFGFGYPFRPGFGYPYSFRYTYGFGYPYAFGFGYPYAFGFGYPYWLGRGFGYRRYPWYPIVGYSSGGYGYRAAGVRPRPGTLVVDVTDARSEELVWRGWAEGALREMPRTGDPARYVDEVVNKIMKDFPPSPE